MSLNHNKFIELMPKIELHFHFDGAIPANCIYELSRKYGNKDKFVSANDVKKHYSYKDFPHFIDTWIWQSQFLKEYEDFTYVAEKIAENLISQNIKYVEASFTPEDFAKQHGLSRIKIGESIRRGFDKYKDSVTVNLIYDFNRGLGPDIAMEQFSDVLELREFGVLGIGVGGREDLVPAEAFKSLYIKAKDNGLRTTIHAGEFKGPESVWAAAIECKAERIGHCTTAIKDEKLIAHLKETQIHCELNPVSNYKTRVIKKIEDHPVRFYFDNGLNISINTDDPVMFNTSLLDEYTNLVEVFGFNLIEIRKILEMTVKSSWACDNLKIELLNEINKFYSLNI